MRFMTFVKHQEEQSQPPQALMDAMEEFIGEAVANGTFISGGGLGVTAQRAEVRLAGGEITTTDGPFAEAKEIAGGFAILEFRDLEEAKENARRMIELHKQHWPGWEGASEICPIFE